MKVSFDIKLTEKDLYKFNLRQAYRGMQGMLSLLLPVLIFAYAIASFETVSIGSTLVYVGLGILFLVYVPVSLWFRVKKTIQDPNNAISKKIHYDFAEDVIRVSVEQEEVEFKWENIYQMKAQKDMVLVYTNRINAYILPMEQIGEAYKELSELAHGKLEKYRIKMK